MYDLCHCHLHAFANENDNICSTPTYLHKVHQDTTHNPLVATMEGNYLWNSAGKLENIYIN